MACCAAIALVIGLVRGAWFRLVPGARPAEVAFAPPVRRPLGAVPPRPSVRPVPSRRRLAPPVLTGFALGTLGYTALVAALLLAGLARSRPSDLWVPRDIALVLVAGAAAALGHRQDRITAAPVLLGIGIAWSELGLLDMHVLGLFTFPRAGAALDLLFHGAGLLLVLLTLPRVLTPTPKAQAA